MAEETIPLWEYRVETVGSAWSGTKDAELDSLLNTWGEQGWEVINVIINNSNRRVTVVAKRPLTRSARRQRTHEAEV